MKTSPYTRQKAEDRGRDSAIRFMVARRKYPLTRHPENPFSIDQEEERTAWQAGFDAAMRRHGK